MKKLKVLLPVSVLICSMILGLTSCGSKFDASDEYFGYDLLSDGTFEISAKDIQNMPFDVVIPETFDGIKVTQISKKGFKGCKQILSVKIPESVKSIESKAFMDCESLQYVYLEKGTNVEGSVFKNCSEIRTFHFNGTRFEWTQQRNKWDWLWNTGIENYDIICTDGSL